MRPTVATLLALAALAAVIRAPAARADGDPASDYLLSQQVFYPFEVKFPAEQQARFSALVKAANDAGFKIRVALITSSYDLGSITLVWRKPREYAPFLSQEVAFLYKQRILVVMPNGFGFAWHGHSSTAQYKVLANIPIPAGDEGLLTAAGTAVQRLAAASGVKVSAPSHVTTQGQRNSRDRIKLIAAAIVVLLLAFGLRFGLRLWRRTGAVGSPDARK